MTMIKKAIIENRIYDLVGFEDYAFNPTIYGPEHNAIYDNGMIYPIRNKTDFRPGAYDLGPAMMFVQPNPNQEDYDKYTSQNIIDFDNASSLRDVIDRQNALKSAERTILTTVDNLFIPDIGENDSPEMKGLKEAIGLKQIDIDKYSQRFGDNFNNDKRLLRRDSITMSKLKSMMDILDMKGTLIIEDASPDVPNPIGKQIVVDLSGSIDEEEKLNESTKSDISV